MLKAPTQAEDMSLELRRWTKYKNMNSVRSLTESRNECALPDQGCRPTRETPKSGRLVPASIQGVCTAERKGKEAGRRKARGDRKQWPAMEWRREKDSCPLYHVPQRERVRWTLGRYHVYGSGTSAWRWRFEDVGRIMQWVQSDRKWSSVGFPYEVPR